MAFLAPWVQYHGCFTALLPVNQSLGRLRAFLAGDSLAGDSYALRFHGLESGDD
jgi:hypothetical protein